MSPPYELVPEILVYWEGAQSTWKPIKTHENITLQKQTNKITYENRRKLQQKKGTQDIMSFFLTNPGVTIFLQ